VEAKGLLDLNNLIIAGDFNFSTGIDEVWGVSALIDSHATFFRDLFLRHHLVDVKPVEVVPTWRNCRIGADGIQKRLDRVYASAELLNDSTLFRSWVDHPFISDHAPVLFQLDYGFKPVYYPFKFNSALLKEELFGDLVREVWNAPQDSMRDGPQSRLVGKLCRLKARVKKWIVVKKKREQHAYNQIEEEITTLIKESLEHQTTTKPLNRLKALETERNRMLVAKEELWRQKSRATWILSGDRNTKYFHRFASFRRNKKHLWEVKDDSDHVHTGQEAIKAEAMRHFSSFYKDTHNPIVDQIESV
jgi:hypothetical protein